MWTCTALNAEVVTRWHHLENVDIALQICFNYSPDISSLCKDLVAVTIDSLALRLVVATQIPPKAYVPSISLLALVFLSLSHCLFCTDITLLFVSSTAAVILFPSTAFQSLHTPSWWDAPYADTERWGIARFVQKQLFLVRVMRAIKHHRDFLVSECKW